jgi:hypothetical protein
MGKTWSSNWLDKHQHKRSCQIDENSSQGEKVVKLGPVD